MNTNKKHILIIGAGPAGLTAAYELIPYLKEYEVTIVEKDTIVGGISRTVDYKGNKIDIGGHRFFSKSDRVMQWWTKLYPVLHASADKQINYQDKQAQLDSVFFTETDQEEVMLLRQRLSRILFSGSLFDYPVKANLQTLYKLGFVYSVQVVFSYLYAQLFPRKPEKNLEDFFINRFGNKLYRTFFKDYTEKVWGIPCTEIDPGWGAQRIKSLSLFQTIWHQVKKVFKAKEGIAQKGTTTSLIEQFIYPKYGPGQLWQTVADTCTNAGIQLYFNSIPEKIVMENNRIKAVELNKAGKKEIIYPDFVISSMPIKDLMDLCDVAEPKIKAIAGALPYRDFITVGLLLKLKKQKPLLDTWIYLQDGNLKAGRLQLFNNWSPYMVKDPQYTWVGLEYFCQEGDEFWAKDDEALKTFAQEEIRSCGIFDIDHIADSCVIRMPKTYPSYTGVYKDFAEVQKYMDTISNLYPVGRNGMHRYNNQDHSMLTAMESVHQIVTGQGRKSDIWNINSEEEYHEEK